MPSVGPPEHRRFCAIDSWEEQKSARGKKRDHDYFQKRLSSGDILRTKVSRNKKEYGAGFWRRIWQDQLRLESESQFWEALRTGEPVTRAQEATPPQRPTLPVWLVEQLTFTAKVPLVEVKKMTLAEAEARWLAHRTRGPAPES